MNLAERGLPKKKPCATDDGEPLKKMHARWFFAESMSLLGTRRAGQVLDLDRWTVLAVRDAAQSGPRDTIRRLTPFCRAQERSHSRIWRLAFAPVVENFFC